MRSRLLVVALLILVAFVAGFAFPVGSSPALASETESEEAQASSENEETANQGSTETVTADKEEKEEEQKDPESGDGAEEVKDPPQDPAPEETQTEQTEETKLSGDDLKGGTQDPVDQKQEPSQDSGAAQTNNAAASGAPDPVQADPIMTASSEVFVPTPPAEFFIGPQFDPLPDGSGWGRRVVYSVSQQRVWLVEEGETVVDSWLVSGRRGTPRAGTYKVFSKSRHARAVGNKVRMEYMVRFARGRRLAIGFHSIPVNRRTGAPIQSEAELGQYRSAGCVRQSMGDAIKLWDFAPVGTKVVVTG